MHVKYSALLFVLTSGSTAVQCDAPNFLCENGTKCIDSIKLCDDHYDCKDYTDEGLLCGKYKALNRCFVVLKRLIITERTTLL